jgi:adenylate cyclase
MKSRKDTPEAEPAPRRRNERLSIKVPVRVRRGGRGKGGPEETTTLDISSGGVRFVAAQAYAAETRVRLCFLETESHPSGPHEIPARVLRVTESPGGTLVVVGFENTRLANLVLSELLRSRMRMTSALLEISQAFSPGASLEDVVAAIGAITEKAVEAERAWLFVHEPGEGILRARASRGRVQEVFQVPCGEGLVGRAAACAEPTNVADLRENARYLPEQEPYFDAQTRSVLCVPLPRWDGGSPGVLVAINKRYGTFSREDEQLACAIAQQASSVLREARLFEEVRNARMYNESILQSIATGVVTFDAAGRLVTANRAAGETFGIRSGEVAGRHHTAIFDPAANGRLSSLIEEARRAESLLNAYDLRYVRADGANLSLNVSVFPLRDARGTTLGSVLVSVDITHEQRLMYTFSRYVAREVAEQVLQDSGLLKLGGTRVDVSILLVDIRGFTTMSERMEPEEVVELLNTYYPRMINVIFRHQGMVDKFIGDAILAVFGVPTPRPDDPLRAVQAARELHEQVRAINGERAERGEPPIAIGIGITSGHVICGNIGSERRMDYTVIGDAVNLAARLEGLTKTLERNILVNERVRDAIKGKIPCESLGFFKVKGKKEEVEVFAVKASG